MGFRKICWVSTSKAAISPRQQGQAGENFKSSWASDNSEVGGGTL